MKVNLLLFLFIQICTTRNINIQLFHETPILIGFTTLIKLNERLQLVIELCFILDDYMWKILIPRPPFFVIQFVSS